MILNSTNTTLDLERSTGDSYSVHWRAVIAGVLVSVLSYLILSSLGMALGASEVREAIQTGEMPQNLGSGLGTWMVVTVLVSLFLGSYASGRVSGFIATRVGYIQGVVISALFFGLLITQAGAALGVLSSGLGAIKNVIAGSASNLANNPRITDIVEDGVSDLDLQTNTRTVVSGLLSRLASGDTSSAVSYLAAQAGISPVEARARYQVISLKVTEMAQQAADTAKLVASFACLIMVLGTALAMLGGALGAQFNLRKPVDRLDQSALRSLREVSAYT